MHKPMIAMSLRPAATKATAIIKPATAGNFVKRTTWPSCFVVPFRRKPLNPFDWSVDEARQPGRHDALQHQRHAQRDRDSLKFKSRVHDGQSTDGRRDRNAPASALTKFLRSLQPISKPRHAGCSSRALIPEPPLGTPQSPAVAPTQRGSPFE